MDFYHLDWLTRRAQPSLLRTYPLWSVVQGKTGALVQLVSNRHGLIESCQYQRLTRALEARQ